VGSRAGKAHAACLRVEVDKHFFTIVFQCILAVLKILKVRTPYDGEGEARTNGKLLFQGGEVTCYAGEATE
jgi:hypothetical protein